MKTKIKLGPDNTAMLGKCLSCARLFCEDTTRKEIDKIIKYLVPRDHQQYCYMNLEHVFISWSCAKLCLDEPSINFTDKDNMHIGKIVYKLALILDNKDDVEWKEFS